MPEIRRDGAVSLLKKGIEKGMISPCHESAWPQNIWAVGATGLVFEAQLENATQGFHHGYPMPNDDDFRRTVLAEWEVR